MQAEKEASRKTAESFEETLGAYIGTKMRSLAAKLKALKEVRYGFFPKTVLFIISLFISWKSCMLFCFPKVLFF